MRVTGRAPADASVAGWGDVPLSQAPLQATTVDAAQMREAGVRRVSDLARFDAAVSDAYDTEGYIDYFTVRGFVIDNRFNYRRDGLPINAETSIPLDNKARVDILKGLSGMQAGTSAPGGLVDLTVKRPLDAPLSSAFIEWRERGSVLGAVDLSRRFGTDNAFGLRLNAAAEHIDPKVRDASGHRNLLALAGDWRVAKGTLLEAEVETSRRSQPSVPGFSLLGDVLPSVPDPRLNLNNQPWSEPVVFDATTASLRLTQELNADWRLVAHGAVQRLKTDDRLAFAFGCFDPEPPPDGTYYADRFCPNGNFDLYDYRSENEQRRNGVLDLSLHGQFATGSLGHTLVAGGLQSRVRHRFETQAFNFVGTGNVDGTVTTPADPTPTTPSTNRDERSTELYLRDRIAFGPHTALWLGARYTRLHRTTDSTDGLSHTDYSQSFTTPFAAASYAFTPGQIVYASWGRGVESDVAPDLPRYTNRGQPHPRREKPAGGDRLQGRQRAARVEPGGIRHREAALRRRRHLHRRRRRPARLHPNPRRRTAAPRRRGRRRLAPGRARAARRRPMAAGAAGGHAEPGARRQAADQRPGPDAPAAGALRRRSRAGAGRARRRQLRERTRGAARQQHRDPVGDPFRPRLRPPAAPRRRRLDPARRRRQRLRPTGLARVAVPVQPRLPLPAGTADVADVAAGRPLSRAPGAAGYNSRLFLDSSVGRAPDC